MELDKAAVIHGLADDHQVPNHQTDTTTEYSFGGLDDPDPFGLDDLFAQMLSHHHQPHRKSITTRDLLCLVVTRVETHERSRDAGRPRRRAKYGSSLDLHEPVARFALPR
jgi:hypothetical protein